MAEGVDLDRMEGSQTQSVEEAELKESKEDESLEEGMPTCSTFARPIPLLPCPGRGAKRMKTSDLIIFENSARTAYQQFWPNL